MNIYMDRTEFLLKFHPRAHRTSGMLPLVHPDLFITDKIQTHRYPENFQKEIPNQISFKSELLITNEAHDGLWLFIDDNNKRTSFFGGYITPEDWKYCHTNPYYVMFSTLIRAMVEAHPICRESVSFDPFLQMSVEPTAREFVDMLCYLLRQFGLEVSTNCTMLNFYQYWMYPIGCNEKRCLDSMRIYTLMEVKEPLGKIPALSGYTNQGGNLVWYSRRDHMLNLKEKASRESLFDARYPDDLRVTDSGLDILDNIFRNESIFGKLNIY